MHTLFPPNTTIRDYAYEPSNRLHTGDFPTPLVYDEEPRPRSVTEEVSEELHQMHMDIRGEINRKARALFEFTPENDNEVPLSEGQEIWISYRHGQGWLVAEDPATGENGLVPEEYVEIEGDDDEWVDTDESEEEYSKSAQHSLSDKEG